MTELRPQIIQAYRNLYKQSSIAVHYSPAPRKVIRDRLRKGFRKGHISDFDPPRIQNTLQFLRGACFNHTLEHKVLLSLMHTWRMQERFLSEKMYLHYNQKTQQEQLDIRRTAYDQFNHLIRMLNESMGMCIR